MNTKRKHWHCCDLVFLKGLYVGNLVTAWHGMAAVWTSDGVKLGVPHSLQTLSFEAIKVVLVGPRVLSLDRANIRNVFDS